MYKRILEDSIVKQLTFYPVVAISGPRQYRETILAKKIQ